MSRAALSLSVLGALTLCYEHSPVMPRIVRTRRSWVMLLVAISCLAAHGARVHAHAGPQVSKIFWNSAQPNIVLLSNRGLIYGDMGESNWRLMCNDALKISTSEVPDIALLRDGGIMAATSLGLRVTHDQGCSWQSVPPYDSLNATSLLSDPQQPDRLYLSTFGPGQSALRVSGDAGQTWNALLSLSDTDYLRFVLLPASDPQRIYTRNLAFGTDSFSYALYRSLDAGATWEHFPIDLNAMETDLDLLGVSPTDPDLIIASTETSDPIAMPERLLVSHDGGKTFDNPTSVHVITSVTFSADGKTIWLATDDGLYSSSDDARSWARVGEAEYLSCANQHGAQLLSCGFFHGIPAGNPGIGVSSDGGATFDSWMYLHDVMQPVQCDPSTPTAQICASLWTDWQAEILGIYNGGPAAGSGGAGVLAAVSGGVGGGSPAAVSGGVSAASQPLAAGAGAPAASSKSGCSVGFGSTRPVRVPAWWLGLLTAAALRLRSRRRQRAFGFADPTRRDSEIDV
jgi:hypothetical protein